MYKVTTIKDGVIIYSAIFNDFDAAQNCFITHYALGTTTMEVLC